MKTESTKAETKLAGKKRPASTTVASVVKDVKAPVAATPAPVVVA